MAGSGRIYLFVGLVVMTSTNAMGELPWSPDPGRIWDFAVESPPWGDSIQLDPLGGNFDQHEETFPWESISSQEVHTHQPVDSLTDLQRSKIPQEPMVPSTVNHHVSSLSPLSGQATDANPWLTLSNPQPENFPQAHTESLTGESQVPSHLNLPTNQATSAVLPINPGKAQISGGSGISLASKGVEKIPRRRDYDSSAFGWLRPSSTQRKAVRPERRPMNMPSASPQGDSNVPKANDGHNKNMEPARQEEIFTDPFQAGLNAAAHAIFSKPNSRLPKFDTPETLSPSAPIKKPRISQPVRQEMPFTDSFQAGLDAAMQEMFSKRIDTAASNANLPQVHPPEHFSSSYPVNQPRIAEPVSHEKTFTDPFQAGLDAAAQEISGKGIGAVAKNAKLTKVHPPENLSSSHPAKKPRISKPVRQEMTFTDPFQAELDTAAKGISTDAKRIDTITTSSDLPKQQPIDTVSASNPAKRRKIIERVTQNKPLADSLQAGLNAAIQDMFSKKIDTIPTSSNLPEVHPQGTSSSSYAFKKPVIDENDPKFYSRKVKFDRDLFIDENAIEEHKRNIDKISRVLDWIPGKKFLVTQERHFARRLKTYGSRKPDMIGPGQRRQRLDRGPRSAFIHDQRKQFLGHKDMWYRYWEAQTGIDFKKSFEDQIDNRQLRETFPCFLFYVELIMTVVRGNQEPVRSIKKKKEESLKASKEKLFQFDLDPPAKPKRIYNLKKKKKLTEKIEPKEPKIAGQNQLGFISKLEYTNGLTTSSELYLELVLYLEGYLMKGRLEEDNPYKEETTALISAHTGYRLNNNLTVWIFLELWIKIHRPGLWAQMLNSRKRKIGDNAKAFINDIFCYAIEKLNSRYEEIMANEES
ncbi:hypothetical protein MJO29_004997 [Puccinia striiformis f. sp. tritici]|uniref:Uncharacterized protein n=1 Tax=Puccinia striiformis TaxID=27350 RepID=A0A2S4VXT9_9BASI|nr:hypothetical protein Pst134EB_010182 [Puccinia striiformis f. sp. tritici]KAI7959929.1 hypothetical protein MJO29_004997 [Puccinia striiformis f. sp. tritici]POW14354.1 hypothetical protein PSTT_03034 [Puccinia striiformis]